MSTIDGLQILHWIPVVIQEDYCIGTCEIQTNTTDLKRDTGTSPSSTKCDTTLPNSPLLKAFETSLAELIFSKHTRIESSSNIFSNDTWKATRCTENIDKIGVFRSFFKSRRELIDGTLLQRRHELLRTDLFGRTVEYAALLTSSGAPPVASVLVRSNPRTTQYSMNSLQSFVNPCTIVVISSYCFPGPLTIESASCMIVIGGGFSVIFALTAALYRAAHSLTTIETPRLCIMLCRCFIVTGNSIDIACEYIDLRITVIEKKTSKPVSNFLTYITFFYKNMPENSCLREFDVSGDLEPSDVVWIGAMSVRDEALSVDEDLEGVVLVLDDKVESYSLLEWDLSLALLISPLVGGERVADDKVDVEALGLLLDGSEDKEALSNWKSVGKSAFVWNWVVLSSPVNVVQVEISINGEMRDRRQWKTVLVVLELLVVDDDL
ncbi:hypothetical protein GCK72_005276 [Caenorhabditis remanei]|uniref:Uncharacterized protein n=1 Tax=Caenorhabditis remanei TaxID=31234 RepID=A0A6A5HES2_CAERE|nr:hypothetical protein GCK72_005276 [Caenorhabditis remanei]KAF1765324.1 hypothetical protein GCK72_005276 [Caenorhabditis remanei]